MIRFADKNDVKSIVELWDTAFPDEPDFNEYFFCNIFDFKTTLIMVENNKLMAMAQMIPYEISNIGRVTYIYGAATSPMYRNQGLMTKLLKKSFDIDTECGTAASILIPANKPLFDFYSKIGYETVFYINREVYMPTPEIADIKKAEYSDIPKLMKIYKGDILRSEEYWNTQLKMYNELGGSIFIYNDAYAVVSDKVEEIMGINDEDRIILLNSVCSYLKCKSIEVTSKGNSLPFGMIKKHSNFNIDKMYMNLMFN